MIVNGEFECKSVRKIRFEIHVFCIYYELKYYEAAFFKGTVRPVLIRFLQKWIQPPACSDRITVCIESCLPIGWRTLIWWKNPPKCSFFLVWIAEWWHFFTCEPQSKEQLMSLPHFWSTVRRRIRGFFAWSGSELWSGFKYSRSKSKN